MRKLILIGKESGGYFPRPIVELYRFVRNNPVFWPVIVEYLRSSFRSGAVANWADEYARVLRRYFLARHPHRHRLWDHLISIDSLKLKESPRGRVLEYVVLQTFPFTVESYNCKKIQCALYWVNGENGKMRVAPTDATFDVGTLSEARFEAHECKISLGNFLFYKERMRDEASRKLLFMTISQRAVRSIGLQSTVCLTGLDLRPEELQRRLEQCGHRDISVLGAREIGRRLRSA